MYLRFLQDSRTFAICKVSWTLGNGDSAENCEDVRFLSWQVWRHLACGVKSPDGVISFRWLTDRRHEGFELPKEKGVAAGVCFSDIDMYDLSHTPRMMRTISHYQVRIIVSPWPAKPTEDTSYIILFSYLATGVMWGWSWAYNLVSCAGTFPFVETSTDSAFEVACLANSSQSPHIGFPPF